MAGLTLTAGEVAGVGSWVWRLFGPGGELLAHHAVSVDPSSWEWQALADLPAGVARQADPTHRLASEAELAAQVGRWTAENVLGPIAGTLDEAAPAAVSVVVPADAAWLLGLPLGVARVGDTPLAARRVVFAGSFEGQKVVPKEPVGERLRVLAVFSVPAGQALLDLRRERKGLADLVGGLVGGGQARAMELRTLQYGATPERLRDALAEDEGWDVVHFAGHGRAGRLVLEDEAGHAKAVETTDLVAWLRDARRRLKLVSLSACSSGAFTVAETLNALGVEAPDVGGGAEPAPGSHSLALEVVRKAECSVVAMRYPVVDEFAIAFGLALFEGLWDKRMDTATATGWAVQRAARFPPTPGAPALSAFTPAVFGPAASGLRVAPPAQTTQEKADTKMAGFDAEPARFVGRVRVMTRANAALAPKSGKRGVALHGMAGAGKTACALELAYGQRGSFASLVWCRCPPEGPDADSAASGKLADLAGRLDLALGVAVADKAHDPTRLAGALEKLTEAMEQRAVLVVLDNVESLLSPGGAWLDPRWEALVGALVAHGGRGRLVLTSRRPPSPPLPGLVVEAVHALGRDEAVLLARQLPNLARLLEGEPAAIRDGRPLARAVLEATGGHPKLLELADAHAADPETLESMLAGASEVWARAGVDTAEFLATATAGAEQVASYVELVRAWAGQALARLDEPATLAAQLLCRAHEADRNSVVVEANWADLWGRLGRPDPPPDHRPALAAVVAAALVEADAFPGSPVEAYTVHPLVAETVAASTPDEVAAAVDVELADYWEAVFAHAMAAEAAGQAATGVVVHAARQAAVYLMRLGRWARAADMLQEAGIRDASPASRAEAAALLRRIGAEASGTNSELEILGVLARALAEADPAEAERLLRRVESEAAAAGRHQNASAAAGDLVSLLMMTGRPRLALEVLDRKVGHTARAGLGPWTQLADEAWRLQVLRALGEHERVLADAAGLVEKMAALPDRPGENDGVDPWNVRETLFDTARSAASDLRLWDESLGWLDRVLASKRARGAPELEQARARANAYAPLLRTNRIAEARLLLDSCRAVFEKHGAYMNLAKCLSALADLEDKLAHRPQAVELERIALRFKYLQPEPESAAVSHFNLANYLLRSGVDEGASVAHRLAAAMLPALTGGGAYAMYLRALGRQFAEGTPPPASFDALCAAVEEVDGVRFRALVEALGGDGEEVLAAVLDDARGLPTDELYADHLAAWERTLALLVAAVDGNRHARAHLDNGLALRAAQPDWTTLAERLAQVRDGERDQAPLSQGLDAVDTAVMARALDALAGGVSLEPAPEVLRPLLAAVVSVAAARRANAPTTQEEEILADVDAALDQVAATEDWAGLAAQLRNVMAGAQVDWEGLDRIDTAILYTILRQLGAEG